MSAHLLPGTPFNPHRMFHGAIIPNWILCRPELSQGAKLCYGRLTQYSGRGGICKPRQETLAGELGVKPRQVRTYLDELVKFQLLKSERQGMGRSNHYQFLWHEWMQDDSVAEDCQSVSGSILPHGSAEDCRIDRQHTAAPTNEENQLQESVKPSVANATAHSQFVRQWFDEFQEFFGEPYDASMMGKDGKHLSRLLKSSARSVDELIAIAKQAWERHAEFGFGMSVNIAGFCTNLNTIVAKLSTNGKGTVEGSNRRENLSSPIL